MWEATPTLHETRQVPEMCVIRESLELRPNQGFGLHPRMGRFSPYGGFFRLSMFSFHFKYGGTDHERN